MNHLPDSQGLSTQSSNLRIAPGAAKYLRSRREPSGRAIHCRGPATSAQNLEVTQ